MGVWFVDVPAGLSAYVHSVRQVVARVFNLRIVMAAVHGVVYLVCCHLTLWEVLSVSTDVLIET